MNTKEAKLILELLEELPNNMTFEIKRKKSIKFIKKYLKELEYQNLKVDVGAGHLDSIEKCPKCDIGIVVTKMVGGYQCNNCDYGEIAF